MDGKFIQELLQLDSEEEVKAKLRARRDQLYHEHIKYHPFNPDQAILKEYAEINIALDDDNFFSSLQGGEQ